MKQNKRLKRPLQALLIRPDEGDGIAILEKRLKSSICEGYLDYRNGPTILYSHLILLLESKK